MLISKIHELRPRIIINLWLFENSWSVKYKARGKTNGKIFNIPATIIISNKCEKPFYGYSKSINRDKTAGDKNLICFMNMPSKDIHQNKSKVSGQVALNLN